MATITTLPVGTSAVCVITGESLSGGTEVRHNGKSGHVWGKAGYGRYRPNDPSCLHAGAVSANVANAALVAALWPTSKPATATPASTPSVQPIPTPAPVVKTVGVLVVDHMPKVGACQVVATYTVSGWQWVVDSKGKATKAPKLLTFSSADKADCVAMLLQDSIVARAVTVAEVNISLPEGTALPAGDGQIVLRMTDGVRIVGAVEREALAAVQTAVLAYRTSIAKLASVMGEKAPYGLPVLDASALPTLREETCLIVGDAAIILRTAEVTK